MMLEARSELASGNRVRVEALHAAIAVESRSLDELLAPGFVLEEIGRILERVGRVDQSTPEGSKNVSIQLATDSTKGFVRRRSRESGAGTRVPRT